MNKEILKRASINYGLFKGNRNYVPGIIGRMNVSESGTCTLGEFEYVDIHVDEEYNAVAEYTDKSNVVILGGNSDYFSVLNFENTERDENDEIIKGITYDYKFSAKDEVTSIDAYIIKENKSSDNTGNIIKTTEKYYVSGDTVKLTDIPDGKVLKFCIAFCNDVYTKIYLSYDDELVDEDLSIITDMYDKEYNSLYNSIFTKNFNYSSKTIKEHTMNNITVMNIDDKMNDVKSFMSDNESMEVDENGSVVSYTGDNGISFVRTSYTDCDNPFDNNVYEELIMYKGCIIKGIQDTICKVENGDIVNTRKDYFNSLAIIRRDKDNPDNITSSGTEPYLTDTNIVSLDEVPENVMDIYGAFKAYLEDEMFDIDDTVNIYKKDFRYIPGSDEDNKDMYIFVHYDPGCNDNSAMDVLRVYEDENFGFYISADSTSTYICLIDLSEDGKLVLDTESNYWFESSNLVYKIQYNDPEDDNRDFIRRTYMTNSGIVSKEYYSSAELCMNVEFDENGYVSDIVDFSSIIYNSNIDDKVYLRNEFGIPTLVRLNKK